MSQEDKTPYGYKGKRRYEDSMGAVSMVIVIATLAFVVYTLTLAMYNL